MTKNLKKLTAKIFDMKKEFGEILELEKIKIFNECLDFSQIPSHRKMQLDKFLENFKSTKKISNINNCIVIDSFSILISVYTYKSIFLEHKILKTTFTKKDYSKIKTVTHSVAIDDKAYLYSKTQVRELFYLCSKYFISKNVSLFDKLIYSLDFETINWYVPNLTLSDLKSMIPDLSIDFFCIDIDDSKVTF
jgi:hypothetical protein